MTVHNRIEEKRLLHHLHEALVEQYAADYENNGYLVEREKKIGDATADLVVSNDRETIVFEFIGGEGAREAPARVARLRSAVRERMDAKFRVVTVTPPRDAIVEIKGLEKQLLDYFVNVHYPPELDEISTHTQVQAVSDLRYDSVIVDEDGVEVTGSGELEVTMSFGSDSDNKKGEGAAWSESYRFTFAVTLDKAHRLKNVLDYTIET